jgi:hypothetical protein
MTESIEDRLARMPDVLLSYAHRREVLDQTCELLQDAAAELTHLRAENTKMREALEKVAHATNGVYAQWVYRVAREALAPEEAR